MTKLQETQEQAPIFNQWYQLAETIDVDNLSTFIKTLKATATTQEEILHATVAAIKAATEAVLGTVALEEADRMRYIASILAYRKINNLEDGFTSVIDFDNMLNPQSKGLFEKYITEEAFLNLQEKAQALLDNAQEDTHPALISHWTSIVNGRVPFGYVVFEDEYRADINNYRSNEEANVEEQPLQDLENADEKTIEVVEADEVIAPE